MIRGDRLYNDDKSYVGIITAVHMAGPQVVATARGVDGHVNRTFHPFQRVTVVPR